jgi:hypothetical protein
MFNSMLKEFVGEVRELVGMCKDYKTHGSVKSMAVWLKGETEPCWTFSCESTAGGGHLVPKFTGLKAPQSGIDYPAWGVMSSTKSDHVTLMAELLDQAKETLRVAVNLR